MASLTTDSKTDIFNVQFYAHGKRYKRSLKTRDLRAANAQLARIEETLHDIERGRLQVPANVDFAKFVLSDGRIEEQLPNRITAPDTLDALIDYYQKTLPPNSKEQSTLDGEELHFKHLRRIIGAGFPLTELKTHVVQRYVTKRCGETKPNKKRIRPDTVKKEVTTLKLVWNWAVRNGVIEVPPPTKGLAYPKVEEKPPFMTRDQIESLIANRQIDGDEQETYWRSVYLRVPELNEVLDIVRRKNWFPCALPMFTLAIHTGARRSELLRLRCQDVDLKEGRVVYREKKKSKSKSVTYRHVALTGDAIEILSDWQQEHPGGPFFITNRGGSEELSSSDATEIFRRSLYGSRWAVLRGWHTLRHSFISNLAAKSIDQRVIDDFVGHTTEEMRRRYRHLFPEDNRAAVEAVFG